MEQNSTSDTHPDLSIIRAILFWDIKLDKLDCQKQKKAIIKRVFERGNEMEKRRLHAFMGKKVLTKF